MRDFSAEFAMATLTESLPYREWVTSNGYVRGSTWQDAVRKMLDAGLRVTWLPDAVKDAYLAELDACRSP